MKKLIFAMMMVMVFASSANAETLKVGGKNISYTAPKGYVLAMDGPYKDMLDIMRQAMPRDVKTHAFWVPADVDRAFRTSPDTGLDDYMMIATSSQVDSMLLSDKDFAEIKRELKKNFGQLTGESMKQQVNEALGGVLDGAVQIGSMKALGTFGETNTAISYMALVTQVVVLDGEQMIVEQAMVCTTMLVEGKMLLINQYRTIENEKDVEQFRNYTQDVVKSMKFSQGGVSSSKSSVSRSSSSGGGYVRTGLMGAIIGGIVGLGFAYYRKKKNGTTGNEKTDKMMDNIDNLKGQASDKLNSILKKKDK